LIVPSIGSIIQVLFLSLFTSIPFSSLINEYFGRAFLSSSIIIFSALKSALVTKSVGPFFETCNFYNSPKSLISILEAFSLALIIMLRFAEIEFI
jgi:hypothetical protein